MARPSQLLAKIAPARQHPKPIELPIVQRFAQFSEFCEGDLKLWRRIRRRLGSNPIEKISCEHAAFPTVPFIPYERRIEYS
jgi:hypothetical protein